MSPFRLGLPEVGLYPLRLGLTEGRAVSLYFSQELYAHFIAEVHFAQGGSPEFQESEISGVAVGLPGP